MAYMNQEKKAIIKDALDKVVPKSWKYSLSVRNHSTIVMNIKSAPVDLVADYVSCINYTGQMKTYIATGYVHVNIYHKPTTQVVPGSVKTLLNIIEALNTGNHDNSDVQSDYFDVGHYVDLNIGLYEKPFVVTSKKAATGSHGGGDVLVHQSNVEANPVPVPAVPGKLLQLFSEAAQIPSPAAGVAEKITVVKIGRSSIIKVPRSLYEKHLPVDWESLPEDQQKASISAAMYMAQLEAAVGI